MTTIELRAKYYKNSRFRRIIFKDKKKMESDALDFARVLGKYCMKFRLKNGYTFLLCDINGYLYDANDLRNLHIIRPLGINAALIAR